MNKFFLIMALAVGLVCYVIGLAWLKSTMPGERWVMANPGMANLGPFVLGIFIAVIAYAFLAVYNRNKTY